MTAPSPLARATGQLLLKAKPWLDRSLIASTQPFRQAHLIRPRTHERFYSWTHYGLFFADLPAPHRYLNVMTLIGTTSSLAFDIDPLIGPAPRQTATLFSGTGAAPQSLLKRYTVDEDGQFADDNQRLRFGNELRIEGDFPQFTLVGDYAETGLSFEFDLSVTDKASWFVKTPIYDHFSLLAQYRGVIRQDGQALDTQGLCTYEYARAAGLHSLLPRPVAARHRIPLDFFTYQIINLDADTQILLTQAHVLGHPIVTQLHLRHLDPAKASEVYAEVDFEVLTPHATRGISPSGDTMRLPGTLRWAARHQGRTFFEIHATVEDDFRFGHGQGYVSTYRFEGQLHDRPIRGQGYLEYVDLRA